jgi:hypothetical protein
MPEMPRLSFGEENFASARLGNRSRTCRLVQLANRILAHPQGTLPDKLPHAKDLKAFYRLMTVPAVTHRSVFAPHQALTRRRMADTHGPILLVHDDTELNFSGLRSVPDLGQLGTGKSRGFLCHNSLAVAATDRRVLGLLNQILYRRPHAPKGETHKERLARKDRESRLWQQGCEAIGPAAPGQCHVDIADRGADIFEFLEFEQRHHRCYTVRATHDRVVEVVGPAIVALSWPEEPADRLFALARSLPEESRKTVQVSARDGHGPRTALVAMAAIAVQVQAPRHVRGDHGQEPLDVWLVVVREIDPLPGREPVEWVLLTNVPVLGVEDLVERVCWYEARWIVEELHKGQKTGCSIEQLQLGKVNHDERGQPPAKNRLEPAIALLSVVAVQLLMLRDQARNAETAAQPATELFSRSAEKVLAGWHYEEPERALTLKEFYEALAALGGHQGRKSDGPAGWQTLWRGWQKLQLMVEGIRAAGLDDGASPPGSCREDLESG